MCGFRVGVRVCGPFRVVGEVGVCGPFRVVGEVGVCGEPQEEETASASAVVMGRGEATSRR